MQYDKTSFSILYYVNFWSELVNHEMFDMEFKNWHTSHFCHLPFENDFLSIF